MDGQNMENGQNTGSQQGSQPSPYSYYQDNTSNIPCQTPIEADEPDKANALQIVGLVCGIVGIVSCCTGYIGIIAGIIGLVCAILGNKQGKTGVGTAGLVCSIIALVLSVISLFVGMIFWGALVAALQEEYGYYY